MTICPNFTNIPTELRARPQWVVWKYGKLKPNGKRAKLPINPQTGTAASTTNPATWSTFQQARAVYQAGRGYTGIGYVLTQDDAFTFIDLDNVIRHEELDPGTVATVKGFASYTERSVSGTGIHIIIEGTTPNRKNERGEVYSHSRFIAVTGAIVADQRTIEPRQDVLDAWTAETFPPLKEQPPAPTAPPAPTGTDDNALLDLIYASKQGAKFAALMTGNTAGYKSHSEADAALCAMLAFWTDHDAPRIDRLFRQSGLMRAKWDRTGDSASGRTYGQLTVDNAIRQVRNGYRPKNGPSQVEQICDTWRAHYATRPMHSATQRVLLATLRKFQDADTLTTYISSRNISDLTGLSHRAAQMHLRLLCPQTRAARVRRLQCDLNRAEAQLRAAGSATTGEEMLLTIRPQERTAILVKCANQGEGAIMAETLIFLNARRDRVIKELAFYTAHPALDILDVTETHAGSALATVYTLRPPANSAKGFHIGPMITVVVDPPHSDQGSCGNLLQSSQRDALRFIEGEMTDDAFVVIPPTRRDPRLQLEPDPTKRARLAALLAPDAKLRPFGLSAAVVFASLTAHPGATVDDLTVATGLGERTVRTILKATGPALVEGGYLPLVEARKEGRKYAYTLAEDWRERLDSLRPDLATNGVIAARAAYHAGERIQRIDRFLAQGMRDHRHHLDDATKAQYEAIKTRAQQLQTRILGRETPTVTVQPDVLALSNDLVTVEAAIVKAMAPAHRMPAPPTVTKKAPAPRVVRHLLNPWSPAEAFSWSL